MRSRRPTRPIRVRRDRTNGPSSVRCPRTQVRGILRREVAAVRPTPEGPCGRARPSAHPPRIDPLDDPAARRGRCDGDGLAGTDRRPVPRSEQRNLISSSSSGSSSPWRSGLEAGLVWAFVGGLVLDVLAQRPLGSTVVRAAALRGRDARSSASSSSVSARSFRSSPPSLLSMLYSMILYLAFNALRDADPGRRPDLDPVCRASSTTRPRGALIGPLAISIHDRRTERNGWTGEHVPRRASEARPQPLALPDLRPDRHHRRSAG